MFKRIAQKIEQFGKNRGFTLIEMFVAITILLVAIVGPMTIAANGLSNAFFARDQITAFYLSQEAIEYIRFERDSNVLNRDPWLDGLDVCTGASCQIDALGETITVCSGTCDNLRFNETTGEYSYAIGGTVPSPYTRTISLESLNANEVAVNVTIDWRTGRNQKTFTVREHLLNHTEL